MEKSNENLFTTGELAALCKIHRKTLLFYDKLELIKPEFIGENGYRYYSRKQLLSLEIIISLRKLDIPLAEIKNYLANKSAHNYKELLVKKAVLLEKLLWTLQNMHTDVTNNLSLMENTANLKLNKITLTKENDEYFCLSAPIKPNSNLKLRTQISAEHFANLSTHLTFNSHVFGYILDKESFLMEMRPYTKYFFTPIEKSSTTLNFFLKPAGLYAVLYFKGIYCSYGASYLKELLEYIQINHLQIVGDIYVTSLENHWLTNENCDYLNKISFQVQKI